MAIRAPDGANKNTNNEIKKLNQVFMMHRISLQEGKVNRDQIVTITGSKPLL